MIETNEFYKMFKSLSFRFLRLRKVKLCFFQLVVVPPKHLFHICSVQSLNSIFCKLKKDKSVRVHFSKAQKSESSWFEHFVKFVCFKHLLACELKWSNHGVSAFSAREKWSGSFFRSFSVPTKKQTFYIWRVQNLSFYFLGSKRLKPYEFTFYNLKNL